MRKILGIDPGYGRVGWGIIEGRGRIWRTVAYDCIDTDPKKTFLERLEEIHHELHRVIKAYKPTEAAVEELFFKKNVTTALKVSEARGVILLSLLEHKLPVAEYKPTEVKMAVTGYGNAKKEQVQELVKLSLHMKELPTQDDAADALGVALTCGLVKK